MAFQRALDSLEQLFASGGDAFEGHLSVDDDRRDSFHIEGLDHRERLFFHQAMFAPYDRQVREILDQRADRFDHILTGRAAPGI